MLSLSLLLIVIITTITTKTLITTTTIIILNCCCCIVIYCVVFLQYNWTALHYAARYGRDNIITYLISHGARVDDVTRVS